jgi:hypothetical protein
LFTASLQRNAPSRPRGRFRTRRDDASPHLHTRPVFTSPRGVQIGRNLLTRVADSHIASLFVATEIRRPVRDRRDTISSFLNGSKGGPLRGGCVRVTRREPLPRPLRSCGRPRRGLSAVSFQPAQLLLGLFAPGWGVQAIEAVKLRLRRKDKPPHEIARLQAHALSGHGLYPLSCLGER